MSQIRVRVIPSHQEVHPHSLSHHILSSPSMNPDPVPPVRPLLTHVIADEPLRREAGIRQVGILHTTRAKIQANIATDDAQENEKKAFFVGGNKLSSAHLSALRHL